MIVLRTAWEMQAVRGIVRKKKAPSGAFFDFMSLRGRRLRGLVGVLLGISTTKGDTPLDTPIFGGLALERSDRQRFSRGRPFGSYEVGCRLVQIAHSVETAVNVTLNPRRLARIYSPYKRHIRLVRILHPIAEAKSGCPEGSPSGRGDS